MWLKVAAGGDKIVRFESRQGSWLRLQRGRRWRLPAARRGLLIIGLLTAAFLAWSSYRAFVRPMWVTILPPALAELLSLLEAAAAFTIGFLWFAIWWRRGRGTDPDLSSLGVDELYALSPSEFEQFVAVLFRKKGYRVQWRGRSGDHGVDLELVKPGGQRAIVQCKRYRNTVGPDIVRELYGTLIHERAVHAFLVTTADISDAAREWAQYKPITLIDGDTLAEVAAVLANKNTPGRRPAS